MVRARGRGVLLKVFVVGEVVVEGADGCVPEEPVAGLRAEPLEGCAVYAALVPGLRRISCSCPDDGWGLLKEGSSGVWVKAAWDVNFRDCCRPGYLTAGEEEEAVGLR